MASKKTTPMTLPANRQYIVSGFDTLAKTLVEEAYAIFDTEEEAKQYATVEEEEDPTGLHIYEVTCTRKWSANVKEVSFTEEKL